MLQSQSIWKAAELAEELNVSERTIYRYIRMLEEMGIPIYAERGPYGGFSLLRGYKLPPLIFSAEEATVLYMGANLVKEVWGQTYEDAVTSVMAKLDNVLPDDLRQEVARARRSLVIGDLAAFDYRPWEPVIHTLRQCIDRACRVRLVYRGASRPEETQRVVDPYALTFQWGLWYVVGFCHLRQEMRTFRVDRIQQANRLGERFTTPSDFSARKYLEDALLGFEPRYAIAVRLDRSVVAQVRERHGHWMEIEQAEDGFHTAHFSVQDLGWATGWVLSLGGAAVVLEPEELIERVQQAAREALEQYET
jgi:predicted DNA-binding transcriptional regulator YafY